MKKLLYVIDDINYESGMKKVTEFQICELSNSYDITIFCLKKPNKNVIDKLPMVTFIGQEIWDTTEILVLSFLDVMRSNFSLKKKILRLKFTIGIRMKNNEYFQQYIETVMKDKLNQFDTVIVVSEASKLRKLVADLENPQKIQWIHTDYAKWSEFSDWTKCVTANDLEIYGKFDMIVTLSERIKRGFLFKLPSLTEKVVVIPNLISVEEIIEKGMENLNITLDRNVTNIVTVGRVDKEKAYDRVIDICLKLKNDGLIFRWYIVGDGPLLKSLQIRIEKEKLSSILIMLGRLDNPYPLIKHCDLFALLSEYEGQPVTIQEAMILKTPVIATDVGGISEILENGKGGYLVSNDLTSIYSKLKMLINDNRLCKVNVENVIQNEIILNKLHDLIK